MSETMKLPPEFNSWNEVWAEHQLRGKTLRELQSQIAALTERAERAERLYEAAKPLADMMSIVAYRSNPRMSDGYCPPTGGVREHELLHQAAAIRDAVEKYDTARREAGRGE